MPESTRPSFTGGSGKRCLKKIQSRCPVGLIRIAQRSGNICRPGSERLGFINVARKRSGSTRGFRVLLGKSLSLFSKQLSRCASQFTLGARNDRITHGSCNIAALMCLHARGNDFNVIPDTPHTQHEADDGHNQVLPSVVSRNSRLNGHEDDSSRESLENRSGIFDRPDRRWSPVQ
jgi:hypothetical protein